jgi:hypothetical protein
MFLRVLVCLGLGLSIVYAEDKKELDVNASQVWTDSGIDLKAGDTITVTATGTLQFAGKPSGPEGLPRGWMDLVTQLPLNEAGKGALLGRVGDNPAARPFLIGPRTQHTAPVAGRLYLGINEMPALGTGEGSYHVTIQRRAASQKLAAVSNIPLPKFTQQMLDKIPARVNDAQGNQGDRVNFILIGSRDKVQTALSTAGWVVVDRTKRDAVLRGIIASVSREAYVTLPMSELELFGRPQDLGYAQADPIRVIASRHHFRLWKAPFTVDGESVWAGAGTHDIGFDKDQRNGGVTHKIDPETDKERDYIAQSLQQTGLVAKEDYMTPSNAVKDARTATGGGFSSDGRTLIVYLTPDSNNFASDFGTLFCSVLRQSNPDGGNWGSCSQYVAGAADTDKSDLGALPANYRIAIVPGFLSSCFADTPAFQKGQQALRQKYGFEVDMIPVPNDPSTENAKVIAQYIREHAKDNGRRFILVGYSKGGPDVYEALATEKDLAQHVAAFVTVAGAVGGSLIADALPSQADKWIRQFNLTGCKGDMDAGFKSLKRSVRHAFLSSYPQTGVPTYSIVAQSDLENTSKSLAETWRLLATYGPVEDGQLLKEDAVLPDAKYLGSAKADHFAIALPFEDSTDQALRSGMDKNHFPRAALLETIVRYVTRDLQSQSAAR